MTYDEIIALRELISNVERARADTNALFDFEDEYLSAPEGISVIVPVCNGAAEMDELLISLLNQSLDRKKFEVIFALNGCQDDSRALVHHFAEVSGVDTRILESDIANVAVARNKALRHARFQLTTFIDHDDHISRGYLQECVKLGDYRSVVISNIIKVEGGKLVEDYAQKVVSQGFETSCVHSPDDIWLCYRTYTLNAIKTAPTYMLRRVKYDKNLSHSEDVKYWRDVFHAFTPITVKSPTRLDIYYRKVHAHSLSRRDTAFYSQAKPRFVILDSIRKEAENYPCDAPQRKFDVQLEKLILDTLVNLCSRPVNEQEPVKRA